MKTYTVIRKADRAEVYRYSHTEPVPWSGMEFDTHDHIEFVEPAAPVSPTGPRRLTKQQFIDRLGEPAHKAILAMRKTSIDAEAWVHRFENLTPDADGTSVDLDDLRTVTGLTVIGAVLEMNGVVQPGWAQGVLNG